MNSTDQAPPFPNQQVPFDFFHGGGGGGGGGNFTQWYAQLIEGYTHAYALDPNTGDQQHLVTDANGKQVQAAKLTAVQNEDGTRTVKIISAGQYSNSTASILVPANPTAPGDWKFDLDGCTVDSSYDNPGNGSASYTINGQTYKTTGKVDSSGNYHATFSHPNGEQMSFYVPLPNDIQINPNNFENLMVTLGLLMAFCALMIAAEGFFIIAAIIYLIGLIIMIWNGFFSH